MFAGPGNTGSNRVFQIFEIFIPICLFISQFLNFNFLPLNLELRTLFIWVSGDQSLHSNKLIQISQF